MGEMTGKDRAEKMTWLGVWSDNQEMKYPPFCFFFLLVLLVLLLLYYFNQNILNKLQYLVLI